jgi:hypothetical protein
MRIRSPLFLLITAGLLLSWGGAGAQQPGNATQPTAVQVHDLNPFLGKRYDIVGRLWTGSWRSALRLPTYAKKDDAIAAMQSEAASLNADALVNVTCLDQEGSTWFPGKDHAYVCYGVAIHLQPNQG